MKLTELFRQADRETIEAWCRGKTQHAYLGKHHALCRVLGTFLMYVDTMDRSLTPHLLLDGYWEMWVTQAIAGYVKPGMCCIDVGANYGYFTLLLAELVGERGHVAAYEPQQSVCAKLRASISANGFATRATAIQMAVSSRTSANGSLSTDPQNLGAASLTDFAGSLSQECVTVVALDEIVSPGSGAPVDFIKIDVQGEEMRVLQGMRATIARSPQIAIAMEFTPGVSALADLEIIQGYGLKIATIGHDGIVRPIDLREAARPDTGDHRMLWLTRSD